ncbi:MAG TPA: tRNA (adenosine(37)-N6)-threonylcarbamoyltransferase complex ATPase subunit type 1 TsaE [Acidimicrobiales bacterium]|nr:tRNA (adenosine(37)-N6)-threonylcarbamoyltransferase complex ATPase subunit type 1 TsaE [Acidimicrobiales bacterium]
MNNGLTTRFVTRSADETRALAGAIASLVRPSDVLLLIGELGAGKTTFTKGLVESLGRDVFVTSPTFTLCHRYETKPPVAHVDCFRIGKDDDLADLALDELIDEGCVLVIEWGERAEALVGDALVLTFVANDDETRAIEIDASSSPWANRADDLVGLIRVIGIETVTTRHARSGEGRQ